MRLWGSNFSPVLDGRLEDRKCWQRALLGTHSLNRWTAKCLEMSRKRGVHAARNGPSEGRKCWQRVELGIHGLKNWGRNLSRKVRETRSSSSQKRPERSAGHPLCGTSISLYKIPFHQHWTGVW